jgi:hypothetical protein
MMLRSHLYWSTPNLIVLLQILLLMAVHTASSQVVCQHSLSLPFPYDIPAVFAHRYRQSMSPAESTMVAETSSPTDTVSSHGSDESSLILVGTKRLGITVGSQRDLSLNQSLDLTVSGEVARGIEMRALLSDEDCSIPPEGSTRNLEDLEQVAIELISSHFTARLGDVGLGLDGGQLGQVERHLVGAEVTGKREGQSAVVAAGNEKGIASSCSFTGIEGVQGPYRLASTELSNDETVVAGSERVYLDGELMARGSDADYVIDYSTGEITFTSRRLITSDSRITVDFERSQREYRRTIRAATGETGLWNDRFRIGATYFHEVDDHRRHLSGALSSEAERALEDAGPGESEIWVTGSHHVGSHGGDYERDGDIFVYVGPGEGDYQVTFTHVGQGEGDYRYDSDIGAYTYVGPGLGDSRAEMLVQPPTEVSLYGVDGAVDLGQGVVVAAEMAQTHYDRNTLSSQSGSDVQDLGWITSFHCAPHWLNDPYGFSLTGTWHQWGENFAYPGRFRPVIYEDRWGIPPTQGAERGGELRGEVKPLSFLDLDGELARLTTDSASAWRTSIGSLVSPSGWPWTRLRYERLESHSDSSAFSRLRRRVDLGHNIGIWAPTVYRAQELRLRDYDVDERIWTTGGEVAVELGGPSLVATVGHEQQVEEERDDRWKWDNTADTDRGTLHWRMLPVWTAEVDYTRRTRRYADAEDGSNFRVDIGSLKLGIHQPERWGSVDLGYRVGSTQKRSAEERYYRVAEGQGEYHRDPRTNTFYPDEDGDYRREVTWTGQERVMTDLAAEVRCVLVPFRRFSLDGLAALKEETSDPDRRSIYLLRLSHFQQDATTLVGNSRVELGATLFPRDDLAARLRFRHYDQEDNRFQGRHREMLNASHTIELSWQGIASTVLRGKYTENRALTSSTEWGEEREERTREVGAGWTRHLSAPVELSLDVGTGRERVRAPRGYSHLGTVQMRFVRLVNQVTRRLSGRGSLSARLSCVQRDTDQEEQNLPPDVLVYKPIGISGEASLSFGYRWNEHTSSSFSFHGRFCPNRPFRHTLTAEVTADF